MVNEVFKELIGHTMEVYVDDMLVKSLTAQTMYNTWRKLFLSSKNIT